MCRNSKAKFSVYFHRPQAPQPRFEIKIDSLVSPTFILYIFAAHRHKDLPCLHYSEFKSVIQILVSHPYFSYLFSWSCLYTCIHRLTELRSNLFNNKLTDFQHAYLYLKKKIKKSLISSVVHLNIADELRFMNIRKLPQQGECYHHSILREEIWIFTTPHIEHKPVCSSVSK